MEKATARSRVLVGSRNKTSAAINRILCACAILYAALTLFQAFMGDDVPLFSRIIVPICLILFCRSLGGRTKAHTYVLLEIHAMEDEVCFVYPEIDRKDGKGIHKETYRYHKSDVESLQYSRDSNVLEISGLTNFTFVYPSGKPASLDGRQEMRLEAALPDSGREAVLKGIQESLCREIIWK